MARSGIFGRSNLYLFGQVCTRWIEHPGTWGQFGDFVGGLVNPLIGLCTIWLLVGSLKQSHMALLQAHSDLETTRQIFDETQKTQKSTEEALRTQIEIADQTRDMANAVALWLHLEGKRKTLDVAIKSAAHQRDRERSGIEHLMKRRSAADNLAQGLDRILNLEVHRLLDRYSNGSQ